MNLTKTNFTKYAFVCLPSPNLADGLRMKDGDEVNVPRAMQQYVGYLDGLLWLGRTIVVVPSQHRSADCVFIEDTGVFLPCEDETHLVITNLKDPARQGEEKYVKKISGAYLLLQCPFN